MLHTIILAAALGVAVMAAACGDDDDDAGDDSGPDIRGQVTSRSDGQGDNLGTILIEGALYPDTSVDRASVRLDKNTTIRRFAGSTYEPATWDDIEIADTVEATFEGPVMDSYPVQAYASEVLIIDYTPASP